ncbi:alpha/beta fold hydrolase [Agaribacter marinus]|uniref:AB hydrolase-1 domain-containing protein n=1 Tax=Agaribacter marinus TaxID=1431249 RepID=A0AA37WI66_9ALTE|nr:alpha/beta hydrolase [Agaribacter marinus]GLR70578.1 hypothetical protein GCM10007852_14860 [Agaribacter marinus]
MPKLFKIILSTITAILLIGLVYQQTCAYIDSQTFKPNGKFSQVGNIEMYSETVGDGPVTVVFDSGMGHSLLVWRDVINGLSSSFKTFAYDRAGLGYSGKSQKPRTSQIMVNELHALLQAQSIEGPLILVGHSFGGLNVQLFAKTYPEQVKGLVLVESIHPDYLSYIPPQPSWRRKRLTIGKWLAPFGVPRLYLSGNDAHHKAVMTTVKHQYTSLDEAKHLEESTNQVASLVNNLGSLPIIILARNTASAQLKSTLSAQNQNVKWAELQERFLGLSNNATIIYSQERRHSIHRLQPALVIKAVEHISESIHHKNGLF